MKKENILPASSKKIVFTTLAERHYFYGVSALINSIIKNGTYGNKLVVGYREKLPAWLPSLRETTRGKSFLLNSDFEIEFIEIEGSLHMVHEKPKWFRHLTEVLEPTADEYFFFDSDITIVNRMSFFGEWVKQGIALCEDVNYNMHHSHPIRKQWVEIGLKNNLNITNCLNSYINSGFLGWSKETAGFVQEWDKCFDLLSHLSGDMRKFRVNDRTRTVLSANQDSLNVAVMTTKFPISIIGPEAMGFQYGMLLMAHPVGAKPWNQNFTLKFFQGKPPRFADLVFWQNVNGEEFKPFSSIYVKWKIFLIKAYRFLSRIYSRK